MTQTEAIFKAITELNKVVLNKPFAVGERYVITINDQPGKHAVMVGSEPMSQFEIYADMPLRFTFVKTEEPDDWKIVDPLEGLDIDAIEREYNGED